ncbi:MAG: PIG-L family deacetylase [Desulfobacterales bacterium]|nr:PIG-L family deacetylase [Desulfobacterales bacterium]
MKPMLVISVHPDDETLGAGGLLLKHKAHGNEIFWCIITSISESIGFSREEVAKRSLEIEEVSIGYGFSRVIELNFPSMHLDRVGINEIVQAISQAIRSIEPVILILPFCYDIHSDHRIAFQSAYSCTKTFRYPYIKRVLMMETLSETEFSTPIITCSFTPNYFVDITDYLEKKIHILNRYHHELGEHPFPRSEKSVRALAHFRGSISGCEYAEAFMLLKEII